MSRSARRATTTRPIPPCVLRAYLCTTYHAGGFDMRIGGRVPDALFDRLNARVAVILTAWNSLVAPHAGRLGIVACRCIYDGGCAGVWCSRPRGRCIAGVRRCCWWAEILGLTSGWPPAFVSAPLSSSDAVTGCGFGWCDAASRHEDGTAQEPNRRSGRRRSIDSAENSHVADSKYLHEVENNLHYFRET